MQNQKLKKSKNIVKLLNKKKFVEKIDESSENEDSTDLVVNLTSDEYLTRSKI